MSYVKFIYINTVGGYTYYYISKLTDDTLICGFLAERFVVRDDIPIGSGSGVLPFLFLSSALASRFREKNLEKPSDILMIL